MPDYKYLIVGGGMTAAAAVDASGSIGVLCAEKHTPYKRPPLSKGLWKGKPVESIWLHTETKRATLHLGCTVQKLDIAGKRITDSQGEVYGYEKFLLATGGAPRRLMFGGDEIIYFRTFDDYQKLRELSTHDEHFAVIGGGFIGSEIAAALAMNGRRVTMVFPEAGIASRIFPRDLSDFVSDYYRQHQVEVVPETMIAGLEVLAKKRVLKLRDARNQSERELTVDHVVAGIGIRPNVELAQQAGLEVKNGIVVDRSLRTTTAIFTRPATWPTFTIRCSISGCASSTKTTPTRWAGWRARRWRAAKSPTIIFRSFTPTCSIWAMRRSVRPTRGWKRWPTGKSRCAKASFITSKMAACAACCCGTSGSRSRPPGG